MNLHDGSLRLSLVAFRRDAASADGRRSVTVSINGQITPKTDPTRFADLRAIDELAVCAALH